jgi:hypothetical protein
VIRRLLGILTFLVGLVGGAAYAHGPNQPPHQLYRIGDLALENGEIIKDFSISYVTHGTLNAKGSRSTAGKDVPAGTMAVVRSPDFLRALNQRDCACNIDPPASSYAVMRRAGPYRGENSGPGKDDRGELDTETRN